MKPSRNITNLVEIMAALRTPNTGCPWDLEQDFASISPYTIEEAYEVADAIERQDWDDLRDELGDLLLQPVYHARMAEEAGLFNFADVVEAITTKMIRRHPHVFGDGDARSSGMAKGAWEEIKAQEKADKVHRKSTAAKTKTAVSSILDDVPSNLPALQTAVKLQRKAARVGFDWDNPGQVIDKLREEVEELTEAMAGGDNKQIEGEIGDLLFTIANLARHFGQEPDNALRKSNNKFRRRFSFVENEIEKSGTKLEETGQSQMDRLWDEAKRQEKK
ncbi:MAG: nucleoside triphosphate pyrophosphohydrolase [Hyphomicrobiales bacterium]|nr:nucleoside triphosphate pyrophosphohydrolase [Hyphomicrobiales bacterium]